MRTTVFFLASVLLSVSQGAQQAIPVPFPDAQYEKLKTDWPFVVAIKQDAPVEAKVSWAENLYLSGVVMQRTAEGGEQPWVTIRDRNEPFSFTQLALNEEKNGIMLVKLENLDDPRKTTVTVKKNNEFATLKRDETQFNTPQPPPAAAARTGPGAVRPGAPIPGLQVPNAQNAIRMPGGQPAGSGTLKAPTIPRPAAIPGPTTAVPAQPGAAPAGQADPRKRIRVINSK